MRANTPSSRAEAVRLLQGTESGLRGVGAIRAERIVANLEARMAARAGGAGSSTNAGTTAVLNNGYYDVNGFRFSEYYYNRLWATGRPSPGIRAESILRGSPGPVPHTRTARPGFERYEHDGWEMIYNPTTREVWHLQPMNGG